MSEELKEVKCYDCEIIFKTNKIHRRICKGCLDKINDTASKEIARCQEIEDEKQLIVLNKIKELVSDDYFNDINDLISEQYSCFSFKIVDKHQGIIQYEDEFNVLNHIYIKQWAVGLSGDSWSGYIWISLLNGNYFQFSYSC